jgi:hypothetical protein
LSSRRPLKVFGVYRLVDRRRQVVDHFFLLLGIDLADVLRDVFLIVAELLPPDLILLLRGDELLIGLCYRAVFSGRPRVMLWPCSWSSGSMRAAIPRIRRGNHPGLPLELRDGEAIYASMIFPSTTLKVNVRQYGHVIGASIVSGSVPVIGWLFVVATGPLQRGQLMTTTSWCGQTGSSIGFSSNFFPNHCQRKRRIAPVGG